MFKIRRSHDHLIFNLGILISMKAGLYIETVPWSLCPAKGWVIWYIFLICIFSFAKNQYGLCNELITRIVSRIFVNLGKHSKPLRHVQFISKSQTQMLNNRYWMVLTLYQITDIISIRIIVYPHWPAFISRICLIHGLRMNWKFTVTK